MRVPRQRLHPEFCRAIRECGVTMVALADLSGFDNTQISAFLRDRWIPNTALKQERLALIAKAISFDGPLFAERRAS